MAHTFTHLLTHIIFSTKDRRPLLDADLKARLFPYLGGIIRANPITFLSKGKQVVAIAAGSAIVALHIED